MYVFEKWEKLLIVICRDLSQNSAYGGNPFAIRTPPKEVRNIITSAGSKDLVAKAHTLWIAAKHPSGTHRGE